MKNFLPLIVATIMIISAASCGRKSSGNESEGSGKRVMTVEEILKNPTSHLNSIVTVEGTCVHLCRGTGSIIYISDGNDTLLLRCSATALLGGAFGDSIEGRKMKFRGMFREERFSEEGVRDLEEQYAMHLQILTEEQLPDTLLYRCNRRCAYDRFYRGQGNIERFEDAIDDYRERIRRRANTEGKDYLSFYYLETVGVE